MLLKSRALACAVTASMAFLSACGPVKFSSSSEADLTPSGVTPSPTPSGSPSPSPTGSPSPSPTTSPTPTLIDKHFNQTIAAANYKLDIVLIIDDSNSMLADNQKLANRLSSLVTKLEAAGSNIDWQMCATVTRATPYQGSWAWGASIYWQPNARASSLAPDTSLGYILKRGTSNLASIFANTINYIDAGWEGSDDERGIKAAWRHVYNGDLRYSGNSGCYRTDSAVTYIIISDEDVRSVGGDPSQKFYQDELKTLEEEDKPQVFVDYFKTVFGDTRRFTVNSIIVKPGDSTCKASQDAQGAKSHYGFKYAELSNLTGGGIGSICDSDYTANMDLFFGRIKASLSSVNLECTPYNNVATITISPNPENSVGSVQGASIVFSKPLSNGTTIDVRYKCLDRAPSSFGEAIKVEQPGFFARIVNFFKNLF
ncbi:hypothetical protein [Bdellovibrio bacteriovorus]|nr:hypothetical protein [Bdellovibrio bacteriovorus]